MVLNIFRKPPDKESIVDKTKENLRKPRLPYFNGLMNERDQYERMLKCEKIIKKLSNAGIDLRPSDLFNPNGEFNDKETEGLTKRAQTRIRLVADDILKISDLSIEEYIYMFLWKKITRNDIFDYIRYEKPDKIKYHRGIYIHSFFGDLMSSEINEMQRFQRCEQILKNLAKEGNMISPENLFYSNNGDTETQELIKNAKKRIYLVFEGKLKLSQLTAQEYVFMYFWKRIRRNAIMDLIKHEILGQPLYPNPLNPLTYFDKVVSEKDEIMKTIKCQRLIDDFKKANVRLLPHIIFNPTDDLTREQVDELIKTAKIKIRQVQNGKLNSSELNIAEYVFMFLWKKGRSKFTMQEKRYTPKMKKKS